MDRFFEFIYKSIFLVVPFLQAFLIFDYIFLLFPKIHLPVLFPYLFPFIFLTIVFLVYHTFFCEDSFLFIILVSMWVYLSIEESMIDIQSMNKEPINDFVLYQC